MRTLACLVLCLLPAPALAASWVANTPTLPAPVGGVVADPGAPGVLIAPGPHDTILRSADAGATWGTVATPTQPGYETWEVGGFRATPGVIFALEIGGGDVRARVIASMDHGLTFVDVGEAPTSYAGAFDVEATDPTHLWWEDGAEAETSLYRSTDGGAHWTFVRTPETAAGATLRRVVVDPAHPGTILAAGSGLRGTAAVARSTDGGAHWTAWASGIPAGTRATDIVFDPTHPGRVIVAVGAPHGATMYRSIDAGAHWKPVGPMLPAGIEIESLAVHAGIIAAGTGAYRPVIGGPYATGHGVYGSTDAGASWRLATQLRDRPVDVVATTTGFIATTTTGTFTSVDGMTYTPLATDRPPLAITIGGLVDGAGGLVAATDDGLEVRGAGGWTTAPGTPLHERFGGVAAHGSMVLATAWTGGTFRSTGGAFDRVGTSPAGIVEVVADLHHVHVWLARDGRHVWRSTDDGRSWQRLPGGPEAYAALRSMTVDPGSGDVIAVASGSFGSSKGAIYRWHPGAGWRRVVALTVAQYDDLSVLAVRDHGLRLYLSGYACVHRSTDGGRTWSRCRAYRTSRLGLAVDPADARTIYASTADFVEVSHDSGVTFTKLPPSIAGGAIVAIGPLGLHVVDGERGVFDYVL